MTAEILNKQLSEIPDKTLIQKAKDILKDWCNGGKKFTMNVPPTKNCSDLLIAELIERFEKYSQQKWIDISEINDYKPQENILIWQENLSDGNCSRFQRAYWYGEFLKVYPLTENMRFILNKEGFYEGRDLEGDLCRVTHFSLINNPSKKG